MLSPSYIKRKGNVTYQCCTTDLGRLIGNLSDAKHCTKSLACVEAFNLPIVSWHRWQYFPILSMRFIEIKWLFQSHRAGGRIWAAPEPLFPFLLSKEFWEVMEDGTSDWDQTTFEIPTGLCTPSISVHMCFQCPGQNSESSTQQGA